MNKLTIIFLTSLVTLIQIAHALPMHEAHACREPKKDTTSETTPDTDDNSVTATTESPSPAPKEPERNSDDRKGKVAVKEKPNKTQDDDKNKDVKPEKPNKTQDDDKDKGGEKGEPNKTENGGHGKSDTSNINDFVKNIIREKLGHDCENMSESTERQLYEMFCDMDIISVK